MLSYYLTQLTQLLANPAAPSPLYATADLTTWINTARAQVAGETGCIRLIGSLPVTSVSQVYPFSAITTTVTGSVTAWSVVATDEPLTGGGFVVDTAARTVAPYTPPSSSGLIDYEIICNYSLAA